MHRQDIYLNVLCLSCMFSVLLVERKFRTVGSYFVFKLCTHVRVSDYFLSLYERMLTELIWMVDLSSKLFIWHYSSLPPKKIKKRNACIFVRLKLYSRINKWCSLYWALSTNSDCKTWRNMRDSCHSYMCALLVRKPMWHACLYVC